MSEGSLLVAAGHQIFACSDRSESTPARQPEGLFETVTRQNGPLDIYHPQLILQSLLWGMSSFLHWTFLRLIPCVGKIAVVKQIICLLSHNLRAAAAGKLTTDIKRLTLERFWEDEDGVSSVGEVSRPYALFAECHPLDQPSHERT